MNQDEFQAAAEELRRHVEAGTSETVEGFRAFRRFLELAPPELREEIKAQARADGLIPPATGYVNDEPVFSVEDVAAHLDMPVNEVQDFLAEVAQDGLGVIHVDPAGVARIH